jgi:fructokinase
LRILSIGEILWDVIHDREFLGGAPLNFSVAAHRLGNFVALLSAVGLDRRGSSAIEAMARLGLSTDFVQTVCNMRTTGAAVVTTDKAGNATFKIDRPAAFDAVELNDALIARFSQLNLDWVYFGTLAHALDQGEQRLIRLLSALPAARCFYDVNLRDTHWSLALVQRLSKLASIIKLNGTEAEVLFHLTFSSEPFSLERFCAYWSSTYDVDTICITLGADGCAVYNNDRLQRFRGFSVVIADTVGAGDAFAAGFLHAHGLGWTMESQAMFANALGAIVASRRGATPPWTVDECLQLCCMSATDKV